jgi:single stranded DNA-binding protein
MATRKHINKITLKGNLTDDAKSWPIQEGQKKLVRFDLAVNKDYKDKDGNWQKATTYAKAVVVLNPTNKLIPGLVKGQGVYIEGEVANTSYEKDGVTYKGWEVKVTPQSLDLVEDSPLVGSSTGNNGNGAGVPAEVDTNADVNGVGSDDDLPF